MFSSKQTSTKMISIMTTRMVLGRKIGYLFFVLFLCLVKCKSAVAQQQQGQQSEGVDNDNLQSPTAVVWSTSRFFLRADHFSYQITTPLTSTVSTTPPPTTLPNPNSIITITNNVTSIVTTYSLADAEQIFITGDPGSNNYMTIEVTWFDVYPRPPTTTATTTTNAVMETRNVDDQVNANVNGQDQGQQQDQQQNEDSVVKERRFYGYFESDDDGVTWTMFEARVYDESEEWITFQFSMDDEVKGIRGDCFERDELRLVSSSDITEVSASIFFKNLKLAVFLPWSNTDAMEYCMEDPSSEIGFEENNQEDSDPSVTPPLVFNSTSTTSVLWSSARYVLEASNFEYTIQSQSPHQDKMAQLETESMAGAENIIIDGDPGWNYDNVPGPEFDYGYMSIEIEWLSSTDGKNRRFFGYFSSNSSHYNMFEARVVNKYTGDWESFENLEGVISGPLGSCFVNESLVITNPIGSQIRFDNITVAVFLPWKDTKGDETTDEPSLPVLDARSSLSSSTIPFGSDEYCTELVSSQPVSTPSSGENTNNNAIANDSDDGSSGIESSDNNDANDITTTDSGVNDGDPSAGSTTNGAFLIAHFMGMFVLMLAFVHLL